MRFLNNKYDRLPTVHLLSLNKPSRTGTVMHPTELLAKKASWKSPNNSCSIQTDCKVPLLKITPTQLIEHREGELFLHRTFIHMFLCSYFFGREMKGVRGSKGLEGNRRIRPSKSTEQSSYKCTETEEASTGSTQVFTKSFVYTLYFTV